MRGKDRQRGRKKIDFETDNHKISSIRATPTNDNNNNISTESQNTSTNKYKPALNRIQTPNNILDFKA